MQQMGTEAGGEEIDGGKRTDVYGGGDRSADFQECIYRQNQ
jgi:hypothetical protein